MYVGWRDKSEFFNLFFNFISYKVREKMIEVGKASTGLKKAVGMWAKKTGLEHNKAKLSGRRSTKMSFKVGTVVTKIQIRI